MRPPFALKDAGRVMGIHLLAQNRSSTSVAHEEGKSLARRVGCGKGFPWRIKSIFVGFSWFSLVYKMKNGFAFTVPLGNDHAMYRFHHIVVSILQ